MTPFSACPRNQNVRTAPEPNRPGAVLVCSNFNKPGVVAGYLFRLGVRIYCSIQVLRPLRRRIDAVKYRIEMVFDDIGAIAC